MKKMMMLVMMTMMAAIAAQAKDDKVEVISGDGKVMQEAGKTATLVIDYSNTKVEGEPLKQNLQKRGDEFVRDWPKLDEASKKTFVENFNKRNKKGLQIVEEGDADYKIKFIVDKLDFGNTGTAVVFGGFGSAGGAEVTGTIVVTDKAGKEVVKYDIHEVRGGGTTDFTEGKRMASCYINVVKMTLKASK